MKINRFSWGPLVQPTKNKKVFFKKSSWAVFNASNTSIWNSEPPLPKEGYRGGIRGGGAPPPYGAGQGGSARPRIVTGTSASKKQPNMYPKLVHTPARAKPTLRAPNKNNGPAPTRLPTHTPLTLSFVCWTDRLHPPDTIPQQSTYPDPNYLH